MIYKPAVKVAFLQRTYQPKIIVRLLAGRHGSQLQHLAKSGSFRFYFPHTNTIEIVLR
jgi:hypothetical protein